MFDIRIGNQHIKAPYLMLALADALVLFLSVYIAAYARYYNELNPLLAAAQNVGALFPRALIHSAVVVATLLSMGLYQAQRREHIVNKLSRLTVSFIIAFITFGFIFYVFPEIYMGRGVFLIASTLSFLFLILFHSIFSQTVNLEALKRNVMILGADESATWVTKLRRRSDRSGINIIGYLPLEQESIKISGDLLLDNTLSVNDAIKKYEVDEIVVAITDRRKRLPLRELMDAKLKGVRVVELVTFLERQLGKVYTNLLNPSWIIFSEGFNQDNTRYITKRIFDLIASSILLILSSPLYLFAAISIWYECKGKESIFYHQTRVGLNNKNFKLLKFRTMRSDAELEGKAVWASQDDPRVTKIGKYLRIYRIDELPVLNGLSLSKNLPKTFHFMESVTG